MFESFYELNCKFLTLFFFCFADMFGCKRRHPAVLSRLYHLQQRHGLVCCLGYLVCVGNVFQHIEIFIYRLVYVVDNLSFGFRVAVGEGQ